MLSRRKILSTLFKCLSLQRKQIKPRMKIKFYDEIVNERERLFMEWNGITNAVSFTSVSDLLAQRDPEDKNIDLIFNCIGGEVTEGWAIYDLLRQQEGCTITALIEGVCASMASVILLAAPKENRRAYQNARLCIHNPAVMWLDGDYRDRYTANDVAEVADKLLKQAERLRMEQERILGVYVERTDADAATLQALMNEDKLVDMTRAKELGFVSEILAPVTAKINTPTIGAKSNYNIKNQMQKTNDTKAGAFDKFVTALKELVGLDDAPKVVALKVTAADGSVLEIDREEGEPQVGDAATPDGSFTMEDGSTIIVEGGVITEITAPAEPAAPQDEPQDKTPQDEPKAEDEPAEPANNEPDETEELKKKLAELEAQVEELKQALAEAEKEKTTAEDSSILEMVAKAGGKDAVQAALKARSTYNASNAKDVEKPKDNVTGWGEGFIEARRAAYEKAQAKMRK